MRSVQRSIGSLLVSDRLSVRLRRCRPRRASNRLVRVPQDARTLDVAIAPGRRRRRDRDGGGDLRVAPQRLHASATPARGSPCGPRRAPRSPSTAAAAASSCASSTRTARRGKQVTFQRITFQNGYSADTGNVGGRDPLGGGGAYSASCSFVGNRAASGDDRRRGGQGARRLERHVRRLLVPRQLLAAARRRHRRALVDGDDPGGRDSPATGPTCRATTRGPSAARSWCSTVP